MSKRTDQNFCPKLHYRVACAECGYSEAEALYKRMEDVPHVELVGDDVFVVSIRGGWTTLRQEAASMVIAKASKDIQARLVELRRRQSGL